MTITLPPEIDRELHACATRGDVESLRRLLAEALEPFVQALLSQPPSQSVDEFDALMKELDELPSTITAPPLSDLAMSRESIYEDHP